MSRVYNKSFVVIKKKPVLVDQCGPECGYWCEAGRRCNQTDLGRGLIKIPAQLPDDNFPEFCRLEITGVQGDLFAEARS